MKENDLRDQCLALAAEMAAELNGDLDCVDDADLASCLADLNADNLEETADELAHLAAWMN